MTTLITVKGHPGDEELIDDLHEAGKLAEASDIFVAAIRVADPSYSPRELTITVWPHEDGIGVSLQVEDPDMFPSTLTAE